MLAISERLFKPGLMMPITIGVWSAAVGIASTPASKLALAAPVVIVSLLWWTILAQERWLKLFFVAAILLPPLPISLGGSGPHPSLLFAAIGLLAGMVYARQWKPWRGPLPSLLAAFVLVLVLSVSFAAFYSGPVIAAGSFARVVLFAISPYVFLYTLAGPGRCAASLTLTRFLFFAAIAAGLFACLDFYFQFPAPAGYGPQFVWLAEGVFRRAQGLFYEASTLGNFCAFFLVMIVVSFFRPREERPCSLFWLLTGGIILAAALIFSYSRASLLNLCTAVLALAYVRKFPLRRAIVTLAICVAAGAALVQLTFPSFANSYWLRLSASIQYFWSSPAGVLSGRVASWQSLVAFLAEEPWHALFGIGYKTLPYSDYIGRTVVGDNTYLSLFVETGILGLGVFLCLNALILRSGLQAARSARPQAAFFGTWIFCFWAGQMVQMLSGDLITYWRVLPLYFWVLAIAIREVEYGREETEVEAERLPHRHLS